MTGIDKTGLIEAIGTTNDVAKLQQIATILGIQDSTTNKVDEIIADIEMAEVDARLIKYSEMYNRWSGESKSRMDWKRVQEAMLANDGAVLKQAEAIPKGPIMFGADKDGNILFANGGLEPILTGKTYSGARAAAKAIGLDLFPYVPPYEKSEEIRMFEAFTGEPIVRSEDGQTWRSTWLEDGEKSINLARVARFNPRYRNSDVGPDLAYGAGERRGVRGLLRVKA